MYSGWRDGGDFSRLRFAFEALDEGEQLGAGARHCEQLERDDPHAVHVGLHRSRAQRLRRL